MNKHKKSAGSLSIT